VAEKIYDRLHGFPARSWETQSRSVIGGVLWLLWPGACLALILAKVLDSLNWPWIIVLAPVWLPVLIFSTLLLGAMWLDKLNE
jgi:hypothetical protein